MHNITKTHIESYSNNGDLQAETSFQTS